MHYYFVDDRWAERSPAVIQAIILTLVFSQDSHSVMSMLNTRLSLCAHDILRAWLGLSESFRCSAKRGLFLPRCEAVTCARKLLLGANLYGRRLRCSFL